MPVLERALGELRSGTVVEVDAWLAAVHAVKAEAELTRMGLAAAADHAHEVLAVDAAPRWRCHGLRVLALVRARRGDPGVWPLLAEALDLAREHGDPRLLVDVAVARAETAWLDGRDADALDELEEVRPQAMPREGSWARDLEVWRGRAGAPGSVSEVTPCGPYERALARADRGTPTDVAVAIGELRRLGAPRAAAAVALRAHRRGVRTITRTPHARTCRNPAGLTKRELEVLTLLGEGLRNTDIGERLVVSPKTVDHHVCAILRKLGVPNRTAAALWLRQTA
jgi:ATP/maltotriose-dependent transcriptional regulator MalT